MLWSNEITAFLLFYIFISLISSEHPVKQTSLLFIMLDDLRPELSVYGRKHMITPNFDRLANRSIVFDYAFCQVPVCNPSRNSVLTGLRPDTAQFYNFQRSYNPYMTLPVQLSQSGYNTAGVGKIFHWEDHFFGKVWNSGNWHDKWYKYQVKELLTMNSSVMPDDIMPEEEFRDYKFASKAIETLEKLLKSPKYFMLAVGFKLPHTALHIPYKYYKMYEERNVSREWKLSREELTFPPTAPEISYRCCVERKFMFMRQEGRRKSKRGRLIGDIMAPFTDKMHHELMMGYSAGISFVDAQLGRVLDVLDKYKLWDNLTIVLTADHGMHNGEKGIWEKWSLFDEASRVPLFISHPLSPFKGQHYKYPVELLDIYPTVMQLLHVPISRDQACSRSSWTCKPLQGKSLAPVVLGQKLADQYGVVNKKSGFYSWLAERFGSNLNMLKPFFPSEEERNIYVSSYSHNNSKIPEMFQKFAITQVLKCALKRRMKPKLLVSEGYVESFLNFTRMSSNRKPSPYLEYRRSERVPIWSDCDLDRRGKTDDEMCVMGYSLRTTEYRYVAYFEYSRERQRTYFSRPVFDEELYDHRGEKLEDFTHLETVNLAVKSMHTNLMEELRSILVNFIKRSKLKYYQK